MQELWQKINGEWVRLGPVQDRATHIKINGEWVPVADAAAAIPAGANVQ